MSTDGSAGLLRPLRPSQADAYLSPIPSRSVTDQIIRRITDALMSGQLRPGQKIPTEVELCESMQVSRNSVREAVKVLVAMGVLEIRRSEGTFVCGQFSDKMLDPLIYGLIIGGGATGNMIELRKIFDTGILQQAIEKVTEEDVVFLNGSLAKLQKVLESEAGPEEILDADIAFHKALESTLHNPLVDMISTVIERLTRPTRLGATRQVIRQKGWRHMLELHAGLLEIIKRKDTRAVSGAMDEHFRYWKIELD